MSKPSRFVIPILIPSPNIDKSVVKHTKSIIDTLSLVQRLQHLHSLFSRIQASSVSDSWSSSRWLTKNVSQLDDLRRRRNSLSRLPQVTIQTNPNTRGHNSKKYSKRHTVIAKRPTKIKKEYEPTSEANQQRLQKRMLLTEQTTHNR